MCVYIYKYCIYIRFSLLHLVHNFFSCKFQKKLIFQIHVFAFSGSSACVIISSPDTRTARERKRENQNH